ncbi:putative cytochrome P450 superfamily [Helianthus annuus]|uniref:Putative cytochrome P450 n=1 Tax=Helianthus annuus TaxID=4232 RepID=A0A251U922_HELAN|nr:putative cytochrome P450 superfamily [Helianthus annuus]KAJ0723492.1 putative cytochrome P450 superfamily [Helianthus annuus]KAJ0899291.1 putative cytochrome P450 superfamily [Helianthus annuus]
MSFTLQVLIFSSLLFVLALLLFKAYLSSSNSHKNLPPSPAKLPLIGNLHQLGLIPHRTVHIMAQTYGSIMLLTSPWYSAVLHLLTNKRVQSYRHVREDEIACMMEKIQKAKESFVNLSELLVSLTNNVICRVILGRMYEGKDFKNLLEGTLELLGLISQP